MSKTRNLIVGLTLVSLLVTGVVAVAGNGFGSNTGCESQPAATGMCELHERDFDGDGIVNSEDSDWARPMNGSGYGIGQGRGQHLSDARPMDGSGFGVRQGGGQGLRSGGGPKDGSCL